MSLDCYLSNGMRITSPETTLPSWVYLHHSGFLPDQSPGEILRGLSKFRRFLHLGQERLVAVGTRLVEIPVFYGLASNFRIAYD